MRKSLLSLLAIAIATVASAQSLNGSWTGTLHINAAAKLTLVLNISQDASGKTLCTLDSPDQGATGIETNVDYVDKDSIAISVPMIGASYQGRLQNDTLRGSFRQMGMAFKLDLARGKVEKNRPQTPQQPYPYTTEEVAFSNKTANAALSATLTMPIGYDSTKPCPVVLMVSGSGLQNRDEELFEHKPFLVIADYLARHGVASLRYDDRGFGKSTGDVANATTADFKDDAAAGVEWLRTQGKRFSRVGVLGHSEGATIAFMLAAKGKADFIVCLASPAVKGDTILATQMNAQLKHAGQPTKVTTQDVRKIVEASGKAWENFFISYDPAQDIAATRCPVMAINGTKDMQVMPELNFSVIQKQLPVNNKNLLKTYDGLNHLFQHCTTGYTDEYNRIEETISEDVLKDISEWINSL